MNKSLLKRLNFTFSELQYRANLVGQPIKPINLGILIEFKVENAWVVALVMPCTIKHQALEGLSRLSRELIDAREQIIADEITVVLDEVAQPNGVLRLLAARNPWSFHVTFPQTRRAPAIETNTLTIDKISEKYVLQALPRTIRADFYGRQGNGSLPAPTRRGRSIAEVRADVPPVWMLPPRYWFAPNAW